MLLNTCSVRDMAEQKALGKMGMLGRMAKRRPDVVFGFLGCMAQARGAELLKLMPHVDLVVGTQKFHRVADYVEELRARKRAAMEGVGQPDRAMDDPRFSIVDTEEESRLAGNDPGTCVAGAAGDRLRFHHAGLQHALHFLHRPADARRRAQPNDRGDR